MDTAQPATGILRLRAERLGPRTVLTEVFRSVPFHLGAPSYRRGDGTAEVIVQQVGPGLFPNDRLRTEIAVGAGARLILRGQSATKLYPCPPDRHAETITRIDVEPGGCLGWLPGPLIPFRDAALRQDLTASLAPDARLILADVITPGRVAMGERAAYRWLDLRTRVTVAGQLVLAERAVLDPHRRPLTNPARQAHFDCAGSLYLFGFDHLDLGPGDQHPDLWWHSGASNAMTLARYLATTAQAFTVAQEAAIATAWRACLSIAVDPRPE